MAGEEEREGETGWKEMVEGKLRGIKEHAETYPYVWGSYILVYGTLTTFLAIRWRKLRRTEERVRNLQVRLRKLVEAEELQTRSTATSSRPLPPNKSNGSS
ncbi:hypothetical protein Cni_G25993 [Canna indica]|uniref:Transmembrane protein n=1 Tax=Canna indica TaxID=4628 RepID=A0AAQ3QMY7_9LILI|nr:hypothetical protein Cni_G25993 [Canna indica]